MIDILICQPYTRWLGAHIIESASLRRISVIGRKAWRSAALAEQLQLMALAPTFASFGAQALGRQVVICV